MTDRELDALVAEKNNPRASAYCFEEAGGGCYQRVGEGDVPLLAAPFASPR